jgi:hypothetical protein
MEKVVVAPDCDEERGGPEGHSDFTQRALGRLDWLLRLLLRRSSLPSPLVKKIMHAGEAS